MQKFEDMRNRAPNDVIEDLICGPFKDTVAQWDFVDSHKPLHQAFDAFVADAFQGFTQGNPAMHAALKTGFLVGAACVMDRQNTDATLVQMGETEHVECMTENILRDRREIIDGLFAAAVSMTEGMLAKFDRVMKDIKDPSSRKLMDATRVMLEEILTQQRKGLEEHRARFGSLNES